jgi:SNF2 family DNA or RNA helicase
MENKAKLFQLKAGFAKRNNLMIYFVAEVLRETPKAYYLYGHGTTETTRIGVCCKCGRKLTHPVSVELGIGPECGNHWHNWDLIGGYNLENLERLKGAMVEIIFNSWIPKSQVVQMLDTTETVQIPEDHPMKKPKENEKEIKTATMAFNDYGERVAKLKFPYDLDLLTNVRTLPGRKYHPEQTVWSVPIFPETLVTLQEWGFVLDDKLLSFIKKTEKKEKQITVAGIKGLKGVLYPFQSAGVSFIEQNKGRALIADEMGLGKTVQALAWLQMHPKKRPVVIVTPASLKLNWLKEALAWLPNPSIEILMGTSPWKITADIVLINYDILPNWVDEIKYIEPEVLITDECHYYKSNTALRTKAIKKLAKGIPHVIALSGTPIVNRPIEAYNAINIIAPDLFPNYWNYAKEYCGARHNGFGWDFNGSSHSKELHEKLTGTIMIRRLKKDVLKDLPDKARSFIPLQLTNEEEYRRAEDDFIRYIKETQGDKKAAKASNAAALAEIEGLKQLAVKGKLQQSIEWIEDFLETGEKLVVFANHTFVIDALTDKFSRIDKTRKLLDRVVKIDGSVSQAQRQKNVETFQNNPDCRLFIGNIKAAGVGLTLTASSNVAFLELPWSPGDLNQAEDRCHRIGQKDSVNIHYLLATDTIEEKIANLLDNKRKVLDAVLDGADTEASSLLSEIIKSYDK